MRAVTCVALISGLIVITFAGCAARVTPANTGGGKTPPALQPLDGMPSEGSPVFTETPTDTKPAEKDAVTEVGRSDEKTSSDDAKPIEKDPQ